MKKKFFALVIFAFSLFCYSCSFLGDCEQNSGKISFFFSGELASKMKNASSRTVSNDEVGRGLFLDVALKGGFLAQQTAQLLDNGTSISFEEIPEGVSVFAEASAYEKVGDEKNILYTGKSESVIINEGENIISLVMLPYVADEPSDNTSDDNSDPTSATYIGSKAPTETKSVGSIIFSDGSFEDYREGLNLTEVQKAAAVAVIFCLASDSPSGKTLGVGLRERSGVMWAKSGSIGEATSLDTSDSDGSGNWAVIQAEDSYGANNASSTYPVFDFANTYSVDGFESDWYLPAINELKKLYSAKSMVNSAIGLIGTSSDVVSLGNYTYWSSSQFTSSTAAQYCNFSNGSVSGTAKDDSSNYVRVIHEF